MEVEIAMAVWYCQWLVVAKEEAEPTACRMATALLWRETLLSSYELQDQPHGPSMQLMYKEQSPFSW